MLLVTKYLGSWDGVVKNHCSRELILHHSYLTLSASQRACHVKGLTNFKWIYEDSFACKSLKNELKLT